MSRDLYKNIDWGGSRSMSSESIAGRLDRAKRDIARYNPQFRAFSYLATHDEALIALLDREQTAGQLRSDIHGLSLSVKGSIPVAGLPWTEGSAIFADRVAAKDATVVARARSAGTVVLGTTTLSELAMYGVDNPFEPMGLNPWNVRRTAGGSSPSAKLRSSRAASSMEVTAAVSRCEW